MNRFASSADVMRRALELAQRGLGRVEPNPLVGAVIVNDQLEVLGEGWHQQFGGPHAEVHALEAAGEAARGATLFVTLEPCCHFGKTPPCSQAVIAAGIRKVIIGTTDPNPQVAEQGIAELRAAGIEFEVDFLKSNADALIAPFRRLMHDGRPWVIGKWAMTLDGKIASRSGSSQWISGEGSRKLVHELRGRVDAILVGSGTAMTDDPLLTARPPGPRTATRIVVDSHAKLPVGCQLLTTRDQAPVLIAVINAAAADRVAALQQAGAEVMSLPADKAGRVSLPALLQELGRRRMTNVLVEGGGSLLGSLFDQNLLDEVYAFIAPKLIGGQQAPSPLAGLGRELMSDAATLNELEIRAIGEDLMLHGRLTQEARRASEGF